MDKIVIKKENSGERIDKFLKQEFFSFSRGEILRQIKSGNVKVNDVLVKPSYTLKENDVLEIRLVKKNKEVFSNENVEFEIVHEDENIIVINKPAGLQVHSSAKNETDTLVNGLVFKFPEIKNIHDGSEGAFLRPGIVHRLDKETSGVMVIARDEKSFWELKDKFKNRKVEKKYVVIVYGKFAKTEKVGIIDKPLARSTSYRKQVVAGLKTKTIIRSAITEYHVLKEYADYSLVEVTPRTGRMHQIRAHMNSIGHPIVGDKIYFDKKNKKRIETSRHLLHAKSLEFELFGQKHFFEAKLPKDFEMFLCSLTKNK